MEECWLAARNGANLDALPAAREKIREIRNSVAALQWQVVEDIGVELRTARAQAETVLRNCGVSQFTSLVLEEADA